MYGGLFIVGARLIRGNNFARHKALTNYSYISARTGTGNKGIIARCLTGLGPSGNDNGVLGALYFNGNIIQHRRRCRDSQGIILSEPGTHTAGVINIHQCKQFSTAAEGIYMCTLMNSSMMNESIRFGIYLTGRSELLNWIVCVSNHLANFHLSTQLLQG